MSEDTFIPMFPPKNIFTTEVRGTQHTYYLTGAITEPENYVDLCNILRTSGPQDEVIIRINSRGGMVSSERMIINAIQESQANVVGFIEYDCMSAATGVFLACKQHDWADHIQFMVHCAFWGSIGKNPDVKSQTDFGVRQLEEEIVSTYSGLLSESELLACNDGKEFWFGAGELETRMESFYEYRQSLPCNCGDPSCPRNPQPDEDEEFNEEESFSIDQIVEYAVTRALEAFDKKQKAAEKKASRTKKTTTPSPEEKITVN